MASFASLRHVVHQSALHHHKHTLKTRLECDPELIEKEIKGLSPEEAAKMGTMVLCGWEFVPIRGTYSTVTIWWYPYDENGNYPAGCGSMVLGSAVNRAFSEFERRQGQRADD